MPTVREFITQSYRVISANSPTQTLHGDDFSLGLSILNQLLSAYSANGLLLTIAKTEQVTVNAGQAEIVCGPNSIVPAPDIATGRLAQLQYAWLLRDNVEYPLNETPKAEYLNSYKFQPLQGLPRLIMVFAETQVTRLRLYPAPDQQYELFIRGKFSLPKLSANDNLDGLPDYFYRFLMLAVPRDIAPFKGRMQAWTPDLEARYLEAKLDMEAASEVNLSINPVHHAGLSGASRVKAGI